MILHQGPDHLVFIHDKLNAEWHEHHFLQIGLGEFNLEIDSEKHQNLTGFIINSKVKHKLDVKQKNSITILIDNTSDFGQYLNKQVLKHEAMMPIDLVFEHRNYEKILTFITRHFHYQPQKQRLDDRIKTIVSMISERPALPLAELQNKVHLSSSRISHLFKQQMNMPLRSFQRQMKIMTAIRLLQHSSNLTEIAHHAGFTDSSHFTNTVKQYFGLPPGVASKSLSYHYHPHTVSQLVCED